MDKHHPEKNFEFSCSISMKSLNQNELTKDVDIWSGFLVGKPRQYYVLTHFLPCIKFMKCEKVRKLQSQFSYSIGHSHQKTTKCTISSGMFKSSAVPVFAWKSKKFEHLVQKLLASMGSSNDKSELSDKICCNAHSSLEFLAWFVLLQVEAPKDVFLDVPISINVCQGMMLHQGMTVWTNSHPFGHTSKTIFGGCISKGILCNKVNDVVLLTDARCLPGSEGGVLCTSDSKFVGMIVAPLALKTNELAGLSIACSGKELKSSFSASVVGSNWNYHALFTDCKVNISSLPKSLPSQKSSNCGQNVVVLKHLRGWGSGVVVALSLKSGIVYVASCMHVVGPSKGQILYAKINCGLPDSQWLKSEIVYISNKEWFDFALVKIHCAVHTTENLLLRLQGSLQQKGHGVYVAKYAQSYEKGTSVLAVGHCLFENQDIPPTITEGVLSSVAFAKGQTPVLLHSSCIVHDGASGGALVVADDQQDLLGLIVNNVKETQNDNRFILYPQINFSLPAVLFMPYVTEYICYDNAGAFDVLDDISCTQAFADTWLLKDPSDAVFQSKL